jgi:hypothetical protein
LSTVPCQRPKRERREQDIIRVNRQTTRTHLANSGALSALFGKADRVLYVLDCLGALESVCLFHPFFVVFVLGSELAQKEGDVRVSERHYL